MTQNMHYHSEGRNGVRVRKYLAKITSKPSKANAPNPGALSPMSKGLDGSVPPTLLSITYMSFLG